MEQFWNVIHWTIYKILNRFCLPSMRLAIWLYNTEFSKKMLAKNGRTPEMAMKDFKFAMTDKRVGQSSNWAWLIVLSICIVFLFGIEIFYIALFNEKQLPDIDVFVFALIINVAIAYWFNHVLLFRKDKYIKYFRRFEKQPHKWKVKWAWISVGVMLFPFLVLIASFIAMDVKVDFPPN